MKRNSFRWLAFLLACACGLIGFAGQPARAAAQQAMTQEEFWQQVDETLAWLDTNPPETSERWQAEARRWEQTTAVALPGQEPVPVDTRYLVALLREAPPDRETLTAYLAAMQQARRLTTPPGGASELALLQAVLSRSEFQGNSGELNIFQRFFLWLSELYVRLIDLLFGDAEANIAIPRAVTIPVTVLIIAAVLAFVFRGTLRNLFTEVELAEEITGEGEALSARLANQKAQELSQSGDYRHALRYLYLSALLLLDERGVLRYNRAQTNREYLRQVRSRPVVSAHLQAVVETFDRVWYGYQPMDAAGYAQYAEHVTALEAAKE